MRVMAASHRRLPVLGHTVAVEALLLSPERGDDLTLTLSARHDVIAVVTAVMSLWWLQ